MKICTSLDSEENINVSRELFLDEMRNKFSIQVDSLACIGDVGSHHTFIVGNAGDLVGLSLIIK